MSPFQVFRPIIITRMLSVRPMQADDVAKIAEYFCENSSEHYERLGIDRSKLPPASEYRRSLLDLVDVAPERATTYYSIWLLNGDPIGHSSLKDIVFEETGSQHLHIWKTLERGKGYGATLFCLSTLEFYRRFRLKKIVCEPRAENRLPNQMLRRIGFSLLGSRVAASSDISTVGELNTYAIDLETAERFLETTGGM